MNKIETFTLKSFATDSNIFFNQIKIKYNFFEMQNQVQLIMYHLVQKKSVSSILVI